MTLLLCSYMKKSLSKRTIRIMLILEYMLFLQHIEEFDEN